MKNIFLGIGTLSVLLLSTALVDAQTLIGTTGWAVKKVDAENPYCVMNRAYSSNITANLAQNQDGEGTIALNFNRNAFETTRPYPILINVGGVSRQYSIKPANRTTIIMRVGADQDLFNAMSAEQTLSMRIDDEEFMLDLGNAKQGFAELNECLGGAPDVANDKTPRPPQQVATRQAIPPVMPDIQRANQKDLEIQNLLDENLKLSAELSQLSLQQETATPNVATSVPVVDNALVEKLRLAESKNQFLMGEIARLESDLQQSRNNMNPDMSEALKEREMQISQLNQQNDDLKQSLLSIKTAEPEVVIKEVIKEIIKEVPVAMENGIQSAEALAQLSEAEASSEAYAAERDEYRRLLQNERRRVRTEKSDPDQSMVADIRRLEQEKADLIRQMEYNKSIAPEKRVSPETTDKIDNAKLDELNKQVTQLQDRLDRSDSEKQKLMSRMQAIDIEAQMAQRQLAEMQANEVSVDPAIEDTKRQLAQVEAEKMAAQQKAEIAQQKLAMIEAEKAAAQQKSEIAQRELTEMKVEQLADDRMEVIENQMDKKAERAEVAVARAQTEILQVDAISARQQLRKNLHRSYPEGINPTYQGRELSKKVDDVIADMPSEPIDAVRAEPVKMAMADKEVSRPLAPSQQMPAMQKTSPAPQQQVSAPQAPRRQQMVGLGGDEIRQLITESRIPLVGNVDRVNRVSGPDFAAFKWDTGQVYGSGEQSRMGGGNAFQQSVDAYIQKTKSRCTTNFDQTIANVNAGSGIQAMSADIACVDNNANGNAASILFFKHGDMFYAMAHEADMNTLQTAMDMRDRMAQSLAKIY